MKITLVITAIFLAIAFGFFIYPERCQRHIAQSLRAVQDVKFLNGAVEKFKADKGFYPDSLTDLSPEYIQKLPSEVWGYGFEYDKNGEDNLRVYSLGSDGALGGKGTATDVYANTELEALIRGIYKPIWGCNSK